MKKSMIFKLGGLLLFAAAFFLIVYNLWDGYRAGIGAEKILRQLQNTNQEEMIQEQREPTNNEKEMATVEIDGEAYIGTLSIPVLGLELPVISEWSYPRLRIAPCRYEGSVYDDHFIIAGHNYSRHFGNLKLLRSGDEIVFTDVEGHVFRYAVTATELLEKNDLELMESGEWDLTLFTCTIGGEKRVTVRGELLNSEER